VHKPVEKYKAVKDIIYCIRILLLVMELLGLQPNFEDITLLVLGGAFLIQLFYYLFFFLRLSIYKKTTKSEVSEPVSVIIAARNEKENLAKKLPEFFKQDYPEFEVVVVNDRSWDSSGEVLEELEQKYSNLRVVTIEDNNNDNYGKKLALTLGIKGASHEKMLFTDADCIPASTNWIREMMSNFSGETALVVGYGAYERRSGLLNALIRFDTFTIAQQYLSFALAKVPYMGVGRNMAYTKTLFFDASGFKSHYFITSGDDDLFVNQVANGKNITVAVGPESNTVSEPKTTWGTWWKQKKRHFTTAKHYKFKHKLLLSLLPFSTWLFFAAFVALLILGKWWMIAAGVFLVRLMLQIFIFNGSMKRLDEKDLLFFVPLLEVIILVLNPLIYGSSLIGRSSNKWN
jgi:cellulose synthase/poly-beta-1,6-N-acetylglucosamine synthase-like glycosyltransferase